MSYYSSRMYSSSIATEIPVKTKNRRKQQSDLQKKLYEKSPFDDGLSAADLKSIHEET